jgi:hypothetical protein
MTKNVTGKAFVISRATPFQMQAFTHLRFISVLRFLS